MVYVDIETGGLDTTLAEFKCAVALANGTEYVFLDVTTLALFILNRPLTDHFVSYNGLAFDFRLISEQCMSAGRNRLATGIANICLARHTDIMFAFLVDFGYRASLQSFADELGGTKTWSGAAAATSRDLPRIIDYCRADVSVLKLVHEGGARGYLKRKSKLGRSTTWVQPPGGVRSVSSAIVAVTAVHPDQSWMANPPAIHACYKWAEDLLEE